MEGRARYHAQTRPNARGARGGAAAGNVQRGKALWSRWRTRPTFRAELGQAVYVRSGLMGCNGGASHRQAAGNTSGSYATS